MSATPGLPEIRTADRIAIWVIIAVAAFVTLGGYINFVGFINGAFIEPTELDGIAVGDQVAPPAEFAGDDRIVATAAVDLLVDDVPLGASVLYATAGIIYAVALLGIGVSGIWLGTALLRGRPFQKVLPQLLGIASVALLTSSLATPALQAWGNAVVAADLGFSHLMPFTVQFDLAVTASAMVLGMVAVVFSVGRRLERDTEGLV